MPWLGVLGRGSRFWRKDQSLSGTRFSPVTTMTTTRISLVAMLVICLVDLLVFNAIHNANSDLYTLTSDNIKQNRHDYDSVQSAFYAFLDHCIGRNCVGGGKQTKR